MKIYNAYDLFYSKTNYRLYPSITFPYTDIVGLLALTPNINYPLQLASISCDKTIKGDLYYFNFTDKSDNLVIYFIVDPATMITEDTLNIMLYNNYNEYAGSIVVKPDFIAWVKNLPSLSINCTDSSLIVNPTYCRPVANNVSDQRIAVNNTKVDKIIIENAHLSYDSDNKCYILSRPKTEDETVSHNFVKSIAIKVNGKSDVVTLTGENIVFFPTTDNEQNPDYQTLIFDGSKLILTDAGRLYYD